MAFARSLLVVVSLALSGYVGSVMMAAAEEPQEQFAVVGYLPSYRLGAIDAGRLGPVTDVVYFNAIPAADGSIDRSVFSDAVMAKLASFQEETGVSITLTVGGWGHSERLADVFGSTAKRRRLVRDLRALCRETVVASIDYDWEYPESPQQWADYITLVKETKAATGGRCSVALAPWHEPPDELWTAADRIHLMSYDHDYPHATVEKTTADIERVLDWGCPPEKLVVGIPFYGRARDWKATTYATLRNDPTLGDDDVSAGGVAFNNRQTVCRKVELAKARGLRGVMIWEIGQDTTDSATSLLKAIEDTLAE